MSEQDDPMVRERVLELLSFDLAEPDRPEHDPWWRVTNGELSPDELAAEQRGRDGVEPELVRQQAQLYVPPTAEAHARARNELIARFFAEPGGAAGAAEGGGGAAEDGGGAAEGVPSGGSSESSRDATEGKGDREPVEGALDGVEDEPGADVVDLRARRRRRSRAALGGALAVAAAVVLAWAVIPRRGPPPPGEPLPGFAPEWSNQYTGPMRSVEAPRGCQRYKSDGRMKVQLRPEIALADDVVIAALARSASGELRRLSIEPTLSAAGVITIDQSVDALGLTPGDWTVSFFISRGEQLDERELVELSPAEHPEIAVVRSDVCIEG
ncbi:MAG: hypothetical protein AAGF11_21490 [Myxococcota bacterium]